MSHLCSYLFYPTDTESISLQKGKSENQESSDLFTEPPFRVAERPWTLKPLYPALTNSIKKYPGSRQFSVVPENDNRARQGNHQTTDDWRDYIRQLIPSKAFNSNQTPIWEATREATLQIALLAMKMNEPTISSIAVLHPETQPQRSPTIESSRESSLILISTTSSMSSSFGLSSKKN